MDLLEGTPRSEVPYCPGPGSGSSATATLRCVGGMKPLELASPGRTGAVKRRLISYAPGAGVMEALPLVLCTWWRLGARASGLGLGVRARGQGPGQG